MTFRPTNESTIEADIQLGAVEIKDAATDTRAVVNDANTARTTSTDALVVQNVDAEGHVPDWSDLDDIRTAVQVMDDWDDSNYCNVNLNVAGTDVAANTGTLNAQTLRVTLATDDPVANALEPSAPQAYGIDTAGADTYTTVVTANAARTHMSVSLQGSNDAIVSIDGGTTDSFYIPANSIHVFDNLNIANSAIIQGKNASGGNNYTNLAITIW